MAGKPQEIPYSTPSYRRNTGNKPPIPILSQEEKMREWYSELPNWTTVEETKRRDEKLLKQLRGDKLKTKPEQHISVDTLAFNMIACGSVSFIVGLILGIVLSTK